MQGKKEPKLIREESVANSQIKLFCGDIARVGGGAILNPTNNVISRNSGLSLYLVENAGNLVFLEMSNWKRENPGGINPGEIVVTGGGNLPATYLFHTCIPPFNRDDPEPLVRMFVTKVLEKAEELKANSVILPCLPRDTFGFSPEQCSFGYFSSVIDYLSSFENSSIKEVKFVTIDKNSCDVFEREIDRRFGEKQKKGFFSKIGKKKKTKKEVTEIELK